MLKHRNNVVSSKDFSGDVNVGLKSRDGKDKLKINLWLTTMTTLAEYFDWAIHYVVYSNGVYKS